MADKKTCFIIGPIGDVGSKEREWADFIRNRIIEPVVTKCGYEKPSRADDPDIDLIMANIIKQMFKADLVIADLTDKNPNVFYELGIRHCAQKPAIHLIKTDNSVPFDIGANKAIFIDRDYEKVVTALSEIEKRLKAIAKNPTQFLSQVQMYLQVEQLDILTAKEVGKDKILLDLLSRSVAVNEETVKSLSELKKELVDKPKKTKYQSPEDAFRQALLDYKLGGIHDFLDRDKRDEQPPPSQNEQEQ